MTIDSIYTPKVSAINASRTYSFTYESLGDESIFVSYLDAAGNEYPVASNEYTLTLYGVSPIYDGGQVVFAAAPPANAPPIANPVAVSIVFSANPLVLLIRLFATPPVVPTMPPPLPPPLPPPPFT